MFRIKPEGLSPLLSHTSYLPYIRLEKCYLIT